MDTAAALVALDRCRTRLHARYGGVVFDEWAAVGHGVEGDPLLHYAGPRLESFRRQFTADAKPLQAELEGRQLAVGGFAFAAAAPGTAYDFGVRAGPRVYLLGNHTTRTMDEIRRDPRWLDAQHALVELSEVFAADPWWV